MTGPCIFRPLRISSLNQRALMQISGAGLGIDLIYTMLLINDFLYINIFMPSKCAIILIEGVRKVN